MKEIFKFFKPKSKSRMGINSTEEEKILLYSIFFNEWKVVNEQINMTYELKNLYDENSSERLRNIIIKNINFVRCGTKNLLDMANYYFDEKIKNDFNSFYNEKLKDLEKIEESISKDDKENKVVQFRKK